MDWIAVIATIIMLLSMLGITGSVLLSTDIVAIQKLGIPPVDQPIDPWLYGIATYLIITCIILLIQWRGGERN